MTTKAPEPSGDGLCCGECGFVYVLSEAGKAPGTIVSSVRELAHLLEGDGGDLSRRRSEGVWSPLEYACHVRDVLLVQRERVLGALWVERFECTAMGREERVHFDGYREQDPNDVARQVRDAAALFANVLTRLDDQQWERLVLYRYPEPAQRSLRWVAVHTHHEVHHHLFDVNRQL